LEAKSAMQILVSWSPFLLLIAFWIGFMIYFRSSPAMANRRAWFGETLRHLERIEALLEKIATKLDQGGRK
jgi:hypothetical protein